MLNPTQLWTAQFWKNLVAVIVSVGASALLGSLAATSGALNLHNLETAGYAAAAAALALLAHSTGVTAATKQSASTEKPAESKVIKLDG